MGKDKKAKKKYFAADTDAMQKKLAEIGSGSFFKPKEGKNTVRILPPWSEEGLWYKEGVIHYGLKNKDGKERGYACLKQFDKDCPICEKREELAKQGAEGKELADRLRGRVKFYANVLDYKVGKVVIWGFSAKILSTLLSYCSDPDFGDISDPEKGYDVIVERTGTGQTDTRYAVRCRPKPTALEGDTWEDGIKDLDTAVIEEPDVEKLEELLEGKFGDELPKKSKGKKAEDEDDDDDDDEEEEDTKKKKKSDDDDDDEDDDEEDVKSSKKKKKSKDEDDED